MFLILKKVAYIFIPTIYFCCFFNFSIVSRSHKAEKNNFMLSFVYIFCFQLRTEVATRKNTSGYKCENCAKNVAYFAGDCCSCCCCLPPHFVALSFCCTTIKTSCHLTVLSVDFPPLGRDVKYA